MDARETLRQIGPMTLGAVGARTFRQSTNADGTGYVEFTISRGHRKVRITLNASDTYDVRTIMVRSGKTVFETADVYCDQLAEAVWDAHLETALNSHLANDPRYATA